MELEALEELVKVKQEELVQKGKVLDNLNVEAFQIEKQLEKKKDEVRSKEYERETLEKELQELQKTVEWVKK